MIFLKRLFPVWGALALLLTLCSCNLFSSMDEPDSTEEKFKAALTKMDDGDCGDAVTDLSALTEPNNEILRALGWARMCSAGASLTKIGSTLFNFSSTSDSGSGSSLDLIGDLANSLIPQTESSISTIDDAASAFSQTSPSNDRAVNLTIAYLVSAAALIAKASQDGSTVKRADITSAGCWGLSDCTTAAVTADCDGTNMPDVDAYAFGVAVSNANDAMNTAEGLGNLGDLTSTIGSDTTATNNTAGYRTNRCLIVKSILTE